MDNRRGSIIYSPDLNTLLAMSCAISHYHCPSLVMPPLETLYVGQGEGMQRARQCNAVQCLVVHIQQQPEAGDSLQLFIPRDTHEYAITGQR